jgi:hypothetical protein
VIEVDGKRHHLKKKVIEMKMFTNSCASKKITHKNMNDEHDVPLGWHCGERTTRVVVGKRFYWLEIKEDVEHFVHTCVKCQNIKSVYKKKYKLYGPLLIPNEPWESVSMDFMIQLPKWNGHHFGSIRSIF